MESLSRMSEKPEHSGMSPIVKTVAGCLTGFIFLFGAYIVLYGHLTPGGGFAGGVIVACAFILIVLAEGQKVGSRTLDRRLAGELDSVGALLFLGVALAGVWRAGVFFRNFVATTSDEWHTLLSAGVIPVCNIGIALKVGMSLLLVFIMLSGLHVAVKGDRRKMIRRGKD